MAAFNFDGKVVAVNDFVTVMGVVQSHSGTGITATVTTNTLLGNQITHKPNTAHGPKSGGQNPALTSIAGEAYQDTDRICLPGFVTAVSGSGKYATLTVKLVDNTVISVYAGECRSTSQV